MALVLLWLHMLGNVFWIGAILAVGVAMEPPLGDARVRGQLALKIYQRVAVPGFLLSFTCGAMRLALAPRCYLVEHHWMHGKLFFALGVIALHHVIGARAKRLSLGKVPDAGPTAKFSVALAVAAAGAAFFAVFKLPN